MIVYDLYCGLKGWSAPFEKAGHNVVSVDIDPSFHPTVVGDVAKLDARRLVYEFGQPDVVLQSPPCTHHSVAAIYRNWKMGLNGYLEPRRPEAERANDLIKAGIQLALDLKPKWGWLENPRAALRRMPFMQRYRRATVTYCQYGDTSMKPTDLWAVPAWPSAWTPKPPCSNGDPCHVRAPRGSKTPGSTQGKDGAAARAEIPYGLADEVRLACEAALDGAQIPAPTTLEAFS